MSSSISRDLSPGPSAFAGPNPESVSQKSVPPPPAGSGLAASGLATSGLATSGLTANGLATSGLGASGAGFDALSESAQAAELPAGSQLGNYVILACIGRGAMASVYRAEHSLLEKQVALKVMAPALHASMEARQRFLREARAVAAIQHPNVITISDAGLFEGTPYLVMELLDGEDLEQHLHRHGPFGARELPAIALPLVAALAAAHDAGVVHRDLKPGNVFLARDGAGELLPKLLDFGISKFAAPSGPGSLAVTAFDQLMGSPLYLPPEALRGSRELTARSDQYSLGVVLYECITGQAPFYRDDLVPLLNAICEGSCPAPRELRPDTPPALEQIILRAMSVEPRQRFADMRELGLALLELAEPQLRQRWASVFAPSATPGTAAPDSVRGDAVLEAARAASAAVGAAAVGAAAVDAIAVDAVVGSVAVESAGPASGRADTGSPAALVSPIQVVASSSSLALAAASAARVVALAGAPGRMPGQASGRKRRSVYGPVALLASGCLLLALALSRSGPSGAPLSAVPAPLPVASAGEQLTLSPAPLQPALRPEVIEEAPRSFWALTGAAAARGDVGSTVAPLASSGLTGSGLAPGSSRLASGSSALAPGSSSPVVRPVAPGPQAKPQSAAPAVARPAAGSSAATSALTASQKPSSEARRAELDDARELSQLFFPERAGARPKAARRERPPRAASSQIPVLVNEAPLFD